MFKTNKMALWEIKIGLVDSDGSLIDDWSSKTVVASSAEEAISKVKFRVDQYLFEVKHLRDIDVK